MHARLYVGARVCLFVWLGWFYGCGCMRETDRDRNRRMETDGKRRDKQIERERGVNEVFD